MVLYPHNIEDKLGFDQIRLLLQEKCLSNLGVVTVSKMRFTTDYKIASKLLNQTDEFLQIISASENFPTDHYLDVTDALKKSKTEGVFLSEAELLNISNSLRAINSCANLLEKNKINYPHLYEMAQFVNFDTSIAKTIDDKIDKNAVVKDNASVELSKIRNELKGSYSNVKKLIDKIYREASKSGYIPEGASITIRDGRMVIPIAAEYKRRVKGFIHDESSTGQTVFIEPTEVLEGNNKIRELEYAEKREVVKILTSLTNIIRQNLEPIKLGYSFLGKVDFIRAKALLAQEMKALLPTIENSSKTEWIEARHPLLLLAYKKLGKNVVPLSITIDQSQRIVIISGPNAGGKSVCLKTVGLLQYMLQCGLLIPVAENSTAGIYDKLFIDIGDEQSLDNDLSTYSSHLTNMKHFLTHSDASTLMLIDEFGTGTDPQFGGAIAESILHELVAKKCQGVVTTHYSNIKLYAENNKGVVNGAMKFDMQHLEPRYELEIGKPGSSFSLEISRKIGLDKGVVEYAKSLIGNQKVDVDDLILKLEKQQQEIEQRDEIVRNAERKVKSLEQKYSDLYKELDKNKKQILAKAKTEATSLLNRTNKEIEKTIRHIKENSAHKNETKRARKRLEELKESVKPEKREVIEVQADQIVKGEITIGDRVKIKDQDVVGEVLDIQGKDITVKIGELKSILKRNRLDKISNRQSKQVKRESKKTSGLDLTQKRAHFTQTLDLRGKRGEEVLSLVDKFIDDALLFNQSEIKILHGKGSGILKDLIRQHLRGASYIESMKDEHVEFGGAGITVLTLH